MISWFSPASLRRALPSCLFALVLGLVACSAPSSGTVNVPVANQRQLTVFAASSLTDAFREIAQAFEVSHPGVKVTFNFAGSQQLRAQLEQGASADVFAPANQKEMDSAVKSGLVVLGTARVFAQNRLVVIAPKANPGQIARLQDLAKPGVKVVIAAPGVPAGDYALQALGKMSASPDFTPTFSETMAANVVSREDNVRQVVAKIQLGEADAGIVYSSDVTPQVADKLNQIAIPDSFNVLASYPIAVLKAASQPDLARQFVDAVLSTSGQEVLRKWGLLSARP